MHTFTLTILFVCRRFADFVDADFFFDKTRRFLVDVSFLENAWKQPSLYEYLRTQKTFYVIMKTCPCNVHPLTPHFYIVKLEFTRVYIIFLFLL